MAVKLENGAVCSRFYSDGSGELLAAFQYSTDAEEWAKAKVASDSAAGMETTIVMTNLYNGTSCLFMPQVAK
ncbi:hypothetical protein [Loktanella sp. R86503]|uniref:hypothetical protein n=1 Tax=Loktanella sp. R86503 TaxID=3093847 RepID=UPI0036D95F6D